MDKHNLSIFLVVKTEEKQNIITGKCYRLLKKKSYFAVASSARDINCECSS